MADGTSPPPARAARPGPRRRERLDAARLYLILEREPRGRPAAETLRAALAGGVDVVQLRDKEGDDPAILEAARELRAACDEHDALLILNDRPDLALECGADGVHLGQDDASVDEARALLGADALVGVSTHTPAQIAAARGSLADYIGVGPVYATPTKPGVAPVGEDLVRHAAQHAGKPFFAIGGIDARQRGRGRRRGREAGGRDTGDPRRGRSGWRRRAAASGDRTAGGRWHDALTAAGAAASGAGRARTSGHPIVPPDPTPAPGSATRRHARRSSRSGRASAREP